MATDPETTLSPEALRLTNEMIWAVDTHPDIHVNRFTVRRSPPGYFEYFLGHHRANTPTPLRQYQRLDYNVVPQLQFLGFVEVAQGEHIPKGWYRFTEKALQWYRARHEAETRIPTTNPSPAATVDAKKFDVFISHASEDKDVIVRPLANALRAAGLRVWFDEFTLRIGDSLRRSIDRGLRDSRNGVVVLSPNFFTRNWPQYELDGLVTKSLAGSGEGTILLIWHNITAQEVRDYSPSLADRVALNTSKHSVEEIAAEIASVVNGETAYPEVINEVRRQEVTNRRPERHSKDALELYDGQILVVRYAPKYEDAKYGAVKPLHQTIHRRSNGSHVLPQFDYQWWYQPDGSPSFTNSSVKTGVSSSQHGVDAAPAPRPSLSPYLEMGPIKLTWSMRSDGSSWIYFGPDGPPSDDYELAVATATSIEDVNVAELQFLWPAKLKGRG